MAMFPAFLDTCALYGSYLCDSLLRLKPDFSYGPNLATSWHYGAGHLSLTFSLRTDVKFWDGHPLTARDVVYSMLRNTDPKNDPINGGFYASVKSITAAGPHTVVVKFKHPDELFIKEMSTVAGDVSEEQYTKAKGSSYGTAQGGVMCSGPFRLAKWSPGQSITLTRYDGYWDPSLKAKSTQVKFVFLLLLGLGALATAARSEAVLPAYLLGLVAAGAFHEDPRLLGRIRGTAFSLLTPFFFLKAGTLIVVQAVLNGLVAILLLFGVKVGAKFIGVYPATLAFHLRGRQSLYTTLMMSTGLTFGSISALFGLTHGYIDRGQYSVLVTVVVMTALVPTVVAQTFFHPRTAELRWGRTSPAPDEAVEPYMPR